MERIRESSRCNSANDAASQRTISYTQQEHQKVRRAHVAIVQCEATDAGVPCPAAARRQPHPSSEIAAPQTPEDAKRVASNGKQTASASRCNSPAVQTPPTDLRNVVAATRTTSPQHHSIAIGDLRTQPQQTETNPRMNSLSPPARLSPSHLTVKPGALLNPGISIPDIARFARFPKSPKRIAQPLDAGQLAVGHSRSVVVQLDPADYTMNRDFSLNGVKSGIGVPHLHAEALLL